VGAGADKTVLAGGQADRVLAIGNGALPVSVTLTDVTVRDGVAPDAPIAARRGPLAKVEAVFSSTPTRPLSWIACGWSTIGAATAVLGCSGMTLT
jgi:hypothetical protein